MSAKKRFFWLKLKADFFNQREVKKLRKIAGGDTFTIIYLKMQLLSIKDEGKIYFEGTEKDIAEQLSLELDEDIENIKLTLAFLNANDLIEAINCDEYLLTKVPECIGTETDAAERMRRLREKKRNNVTPMLQGVTKSDTEIEIELEKELEIELEIEREIVQEGKKSQHAPSEKLIFGEFGNVRLTTKQYKDLEKKLGSDVRDKCIKNLDMKLGEKDYKTNSHYITILKWYEEDKEKEPVRKRTATDSKEKIIFGKPRSLNHLITK